MGKTGFAYLSYHNSEVAFALQLATDLRNRGVFLFVDRLDIAPGRDWHDAISSALTACSACIVVLTPEYIQTSAARNTLRRLAELNRPVIPVMLQALAAGDYPSEVDYRQSVAMQGWVADHIYTTGLNSLSKALEATRVVQMSKRLDPERRYVNSLNMLIEVHRSHLEAPVTSEDIDEQALVMPPPRMESNWGIGSVFMDRGTRFDRQSEISHLPYWASQTKRFVLIGGNGVGKTTTLMRLMSEHVHQYLASPRHVPVPLFIDLSHWNPDEPMQSFVTQQVHPIGDPANDIRKGRYAIYVDGLSEVGIYTEERLAALQKWLTDDKAPQRVVIACDEALYTPRYGLDLPIVQMMPLTEGQHRAQVAAYMGRSSRSFTEKWGAHPPARRWEHSALLLRAAMYHASLRPRADFPSNSERLLIKVIEMLCEREQVRNNPDWVDFYKLLPRVAYLAYRMMFSGYPYSLTPEQATQFLGSEGLLHALVSARILTVRMKRVKFWHRSLLNVFAAYHLQKLPVHKQLAYTEFDDHGRRVSHYWDAPLVALAGILDDPTMLLLSMAEVDPYLAVEAMAGRYIPGEARRTVLNAFMQYALDHGTIAYSATLALLEHLTLGSAIPQMLELLRTGSWQERSIAHQFLLRLPFPVAPDLAAFQSWDGVISDELAGSLRALSTEVIPLLLRMLHSANTQVRIGASWALGIIEDRAALVGLTAALTDTHPDVRLYAAQALRAMPEPAAVNALVGCLRDANGFVRKAATSALIATGVAAVPALRRMLDSEDARDKRLAMGVLGHIGDTSVADDLLPYVEHEQPALRAVSVTALGQMRAPEAVSALATRAADDAAPSWSSATIAHLAAQALESIGTEEAMDVIQALFNRRSEGKSRAAVKYRLQQEQVNRPPFVDLPASPRLEEDEGISSPPDVTPVTTAPGQPLPHVEDDELQLLLTRLASRDRVTRGHAAQELVQFARRHHKRCQADVLYRLQSGLFSDDVFVREVTVEALGHIADPSTTRSLISRLNDDVWTIRMVVLRALAEVGDASAVPHIAPLLLDSRAEVREVAAETLGMLQQREAVPELVEALDDENMFVRLMVTRALGRIQDAAAVPPLVRSLHHTTDLRLKAVTLEALGRIGSAEAVEGIALLLESHERTPITGNATLSELAAHALERIGTPNALKTLSLRSRR